MSTSFYEALIAHGLRPTAPPRPDGRWHRCRTETHPHRKNGAYKLALDGRIGWFLDWARDAGSHVWRADAGVATAEPFDPEVLRRAWREEREKRERAIAAARAYYRDCKPLRCGHPYLDAHGLDMRGCSGLRVDRNGWLVVPMYGADSQLVSIQRIAPDGGKLFWKDASAKGVAYVIERHGAVITVVCEGLATGIALYAAVPMSRVVVAFTAGNLAHVLDRVPPGLVCVAADNDHRTVCQDHRAEGLTRPFEPWEARPDWCRCNPGRHYAEKVAAEFGCGVALPEGMQGTDWCDLRTEAVRARVQRGQREGAARRAVDAEIAVSVKRAARYRAAAGVGRKVGS